MDEINKDKYGAIGCCIIGCMEHQELSGEVRKTALCKRFRAIRIANYSSPINEFKAGDKLYLGVVEGWFHAPDEAVFFPFLHEDTLRSCLVRARDYAHWKYPGYKVRTIL